MITILYDALYKRSDSPYMGVRLGDFVYLRTAGCKGGALWEKLTAKKMADSQNVDFFVGTSFAQFDEIEEMML